MIGHRNPPRDPRARGTVVTSAGTSRPAPARSRGRAARCSACAAGGAQRLRSAEHEPTRVSRTTTPAAADAQPDPRLVVPRVRLSEGLVRVGRHAQQVLAALEPGHIDVLAGEVPGVDVPPPPGEPDMDLGAGGRAASALEVSAGRASRMAGCVGRRRSRSRTWRPPVASDRPRRGGTAGTARSPPGASGDVRRPPRTASGRRSCGPPTCRWRAGCAGGRSSWGIGGSMRTSGGPRRPSDPGPH